MENISNSLQLYDSGQLQNALSELEPYMALTQNNNRRFCSGTGLAISECFDDVSLKRTNLFDSTIADSHFLNSALTGSYFSKVSFSNSIFKESNLQYCHFIQASFHGIEIHSTNLSYSSFFNSDFKDTLFKGSTVSELLFDECHFENCIFTSSMLENAIFLRCTLKNVQFVNTNVEFMEFSQCKLEKVTMPFQQLPYVYGLYAHLADKGVQAEANGTCITAEEYYHLQDSLIVYYTSIQEYFPLTNLYLTRQDLDAAYQCITIGLQSAIISKNFRMLKFYCKLAVQGTLFPYEKLRELYALILTCTKKQALNKYEQRDFIYNSAEIRALLLDNIYDCPTVQIELQTNIDSVDSEKVIRFIEYVDHTIRELCPKQISHIEYRHNSDANFIAYLSANYQNILAVISILLIFANNVSTQAEQRILNRQNIKLNKLKLKQETEKLNQIKSKGAQLKSDGVEYEMKYYITNVGVQDITEVDLYL